MKRAKLPMALLNEPNTPPPRINILDTESFSDTFGPKAKRKRVKLAHANIDELLQVCVCARAMINFFAHATARS